ncbi:MAG: hypothetical protein IJR94_04620 [Synergistaceae bacterium]|nr:hypothetical protein [Synergistaceae bacterium]
MKKIFSALLVIFFACGVSFGATVEPDIETHKIIGGLYSLAASVGLNAKTNPEINQLGRFFADLPEGWQGAWKIDKSNNSIWVGVPVGQYSNARKFLREHAEELNIAENPGGYAWIGGEYAWLKAASIEKKSLKPLDYIATRSGAFLFFSTPGQENWWQAHPAFNAKAEKNILSKHSAQNPPKLEAPKGLSGSIYDDVKPASVRVPNKMYMGTQKSSFDMPIGDVIFNPIPKRRDY